MHRVRLLRAGREYRGPIQCALEKPDRALGRHDRSKWERGEGGMVLKQHDPRADVGLVRHLDSDSERLSRDRAGDVLAEYLVSERWRLQCWAGRCDAGAKDPRRLDRYRSRDDKELCLLGG